MQHAAVALALGGPFSAEVGVCHGTAPTGIEMTLTRTSGNKIFEIDGRPAIDIWREITGCEEGEINNQDYVASWAIGVARGAAHGQAAEVAHGRGDPGGPARLHIAWGRCRTLTRVWVNSMAA
jgi:small ligand-binding sensory domain FIST